MKKIIKLLIIVILLMPIFVNAKDNKYIDKTYKIVNIDKSKEITVYFFHSRVCHHCIKENDFLNEIEKKYKGKIKIIRYQVFKNDKNSNLMKKVKKEFNIGNGVPLTVIGDKYYLGYSPTIANQIDGQIQSYIKNNNKTNINLPIIGNVNFKNVSIPFVTIILGLIDGFNPCAMWILLLLINMLFNMKNKKHMWILGITFLTTSALIYLLAMIGLSIVLSFTTTLFIQKVIAFIAIICGLISIKSFNKDNGCHIVDESKRRNYIYKIKKFINQKNFLLSVIGIMLLAISVNLVELSCSAGFPAIFISILKFNNINGFSSIIYLLFYILFYLIDDIIVFIISMKTLQITGITTKYNNLSHLVGGLIMILIGILLILKPEWIMLNF